MFRDTTAITTSDCVIIQDDKTLYSYNGNTLETYKAIGNKYYLTDSSDTGNPHPANVICYSLTDARQLPSAFDFITPVYHLMAIISALAIGYFAYKLIIYPFFRRGV